MWNLCNKPSKSLTNFIWSEQEYKNLLIIPFKSELLISKWTFFNNKTLIVVIDVVKFPQMSLVMCGQIIFIAWHYPLNNSDIIW